MKLKVWFLFVLVIILSIPINSQIIINPNIKYQTIQGFAASDCWSLQYVGETWSENAKEDIAKYLFSQEFKSNGSPEGIGLSMWRVNLGAGSREQGDDSGIEDAGRRGECFFDENGEYDWNKQAGQQWFLRRAKEYGCNNFVAFSNSPLVHYTKTGKGYSNYDTRSNLREDAYGDYADYLATVLKHFQDEELEFKYISPVNEPQYNQWGEGGQEGSPWHNSEISAFVKELDKSIQGKGVNAKILIPEAADWTYLYSSSHAWAGNQIYNFFDKRSENYVGDLPSVANVIAGHSYFTETSSNNAMKDVRINVYEHAFQYNLDVFQTEWSMLTVPSESMGFYNYSYIDIALYTAKMIYSDIVHARVSSWSYWTAVSQERWDHKNRFYLVRMKPDYSDPWVPGEVEDNVNLWALGNYSFFIRPGYTRIGLTGADGFAYNDLMGTAYIAPDNSRLVAVYVNMAREAKNITHTIQNLGEYTPINNKMYVTNSSYGMLKWGTDAYDIYSPDKEFSIPARSIVTIVYDLENNTGINDVNISAKIQAIYDSEINGLKLVFPSELVQQNASINMYSINGNKIFNTECFINSTEENILLDKQISSGVYILNISVGKEQINKKILIK